MRTEDEVEVKEKEVTGGNVERGEDSDGDGLWRVSEGERGGKDGGLTTIEAEADDAEAEVEPEPEEEAEAEDGTDDELMTRTEEVAEAEADDAEAE